MFTRRGIIRIVALASVVMLAVLGSDAARPAWAVSHALVFNPSEWTLDEINDIKTITVEVSGMTIGSADTVQLSIVHDDAIIQVSNPTCADLYGGTSTSAIRVDGTSTAFSCNDSGGPTATSGSVMTFDIKRLQIGVAGDEPLLTFGTSGAFGTMFIKAGTPIANGSLGTLQILKNHTPTADAQNLVTLEDAPKAVTLTGSDDNGDPLTFLVASGPSNGVLTGTVPNVTYTPNADFNGVDSFTYTATDDETAVSPAVTVDLTITAVNDVPSFTGNGDDTVLEDAAARTFAGWATVISAGPTNEVSQALSFLVGNDNTALFSIQPDVDESTGNLTYTVAGDANGSALVTVSISDDGGTANGGEDTSADQTFTITVTAVNDVPGFTKGTDDIVLEDAGLQTLSGWATVISAGPADEGSQVLSFLVVPADTGLFSVQPAVDETTGDLTYTPALNANGFTLVTISISDDGGTANSGVDASGEQTFTISITGVNDEPSFTEGSDEVVLENSGVHSVIGWATVISVGPADEVTQTLTFAITNSNPSLFVGQPTISESTGDLTYTLAVDTNGSTTVTVSISDDGGVADGGDDTSPEIMFTITVDPVFDVTGTITFQGATLPAHVIAIGATVTITHNGGSLFSTVAVASDGTFTITDAPVDTYTIAVTADGYQTAEDVALGVVNVDIVMSTIELQGGLVNSDTIVDAVDISLVVTAFGTTPVARVDGSGNWVDINGDSAVSGIDISITLSNVTMGAVKTW